MKKHHVDVLIAESDVHSRIAELGAEITKHYQAKQVNNLVVIGLLRGSFMFMADIVRHIHLPVEIEFMTTSSYGTGMTTNHDVRITKDLDGDIKGKHVLIVEDIIDTGTTLSRLKPILEDRDAASVKIATMLNKPSRRRAKVTVDYNGFEIPDAFVVGYGLDYAGKYRNLPCIGILKESVYKG